jgi:hypothetical protein
MKYATNYFLLACTILFLIINLAKANLSNTKSKNNLIEDFPKFLTNKIKNSLISFSPSNSDQQPHSVIIPLSEVDNKFYINISIGAHLSNLSLLVDTNSPLSWVYKNDKNGSVLYDISNSTSYQSFFNHEKIDKFNLLLSTNQTEVVYGGNLSYDKVAIEKLNLFSGNNTENNIIPTSISKLDIPNYGFIISDYFSFLSFDEKNESKIEGTFSLARDNTFKGGELFSIFKHFRSLNLIQKENFMIVRKSDKNTYNISEPFIIFGDYNYYKNNLYSDSQVVNKVTLVSNVTHYCNLFQYDQKLSQLWACNISHINLLPINNQVNIENNFEQLNMKLQDKSYVILDSAIDETLIPDDSKLFYYKNSTNEENQTISSLESMNIIEYFSNFILENNNCKLTRLENYLNSQKTLQTFICKTTPSNNLPDFVKNFNLKEFVVVLNGYGYVMKIEELFKKYYSEAEKSSDYYIFNIMFYTSVSSENSFWYLGNLFIKKFKEIGFSKSENKIEFYGADNLIYNFTQYTKDLIEVEPIVSFFLLSVICVIILILIVLLVPYVIYRQRKRAMMEKLQYDVIYKKMDDITKELGR